MRGQFTAEFEDDSPIDGRVAAGRGRGRGRRGRGNRGRTAGGGADMGDAGSTEGTGDGSSSSENEDERLSDVRRQMRVKGNHSRARRPTVDGEGRTHPGDSVIDASLEYSEDLIQWLSEITIVSSRHSDSQLAGTISRRLQLAFDGSDETGPAVTLPLYKSAMISNSAEVQQGQSQPCNDIVFHVGGPVWALDWCPRRPGWAQSGNQESEFLAVGAHPASAPYNRLGKLLKGEGLLQIWGFDFSAVGQLAADSQGDGSTAKTRSSSSTAAVKRPPASSREKISGNGRSRGMRTSGPDVAAELHGDVLLLEDTRTGHGVLSKIHSDNVRDAYVVPRNSSPPTQSQPASSPREKRPRKLKESARAKGSDTGVLETRFPRWYREEGPAKMVLGVVHDGLVSWDAKWRPVGESTNLGLKRELLRLGFIALLLGDGSIQVFDVPLPRIVPIPSREGSLTGNVPLNVRMDPVFRWADVRSGGHKSIPLSLEWSTWDPHDLILVGFHDATVGLWKFFSNPQQPEARPLMFFTADSLPLRSVAWAPDACGSSGKQIFVTAGHTGWVKFWNIRDPFRPVWDLQVSRGCIHSMDWIPWPRCVLMTLDDGTLRILGLDNASSQAPATGEPWHGTHSQGIHCYLCSSFPIWDAQVSRSTGVVAYAGADGSVLQFQLTERAIVKEGARSREPHYLCGAFKASSDVGPVTLTSSQKTAPAKMRKSSTEWSSRPRTMRGFLATCTLDNESRRVSTGLELSVAAENSPVTRVRKKHSKAIGKIRSKDTSQPYQKAELELLPCSDDRMALVPLQISAPAGFEVKEEQNLPEQEHSLRAMNAPAPGQNLPRQKVSVHCLRWNCNPHREHWLAYGGAAGIVRCQQIFSMKTKQKGDS